MVAPLLHSWKESVVEVLVDFMKLWHFKEDGFDLLDGQHGLGGGGRSLQRLHGLEGQMKNI